jgi:hypothetical protein
MAERIITSEVERTYSVLVDIQNYRQLYALRGTISPEEFQSRLQAQNKLTRINLQTSLGERFNAQCLQVSYHVENNQLIHPIHQSPFIDIIKLGQKYRERAGSIEVERELAEVISFEKVQSIVTDPDFDPQAKVIVISPRGQGKTIYNHNYYDVYSKDENGNVTMSRFYSKSSYGQFYEAALTVDPFCDLPEDPKDADLIASPLVTYKSMEEIHQTLNRNKDTMPQEDYCHVLETSNPASSHYISTLAQKPFLPNEEHFRNFNAVINLSDICAGLDLPHPSHLGREQIIAAIRQSDRKDSMLAYLGAQTVRTTSGGCGLSGGYQISTNSHGFQSVAEFAQLPYGGDKEITDFQCPGYKEDGTKCTYVVRAYSGVKKCPQCGMEATCA